MKTPKTYKEIASMMKDVRDGNEEQLGSYILESLNYVRQIGKDVLENMSDEDLNGLVSFIETGVMTQMMQETINPSMAIVLADSRIINTIICTTIAYTLGVSIAEEIR